jgi:hypothetical protein
MTTPDAPLFPYFSAPGRSSPCSAPGSPRVAAQPEHHRTRLGVGKVDVAERPPARARVLPGRRTLAARVEARSRVPAGAAVRRPRWLSPPVRVGRDARALRRTAAVPSVELETGSPSRAVMEAVRTRGSLGWIGVPWSHRGKAHCADKRSHLDPARFRLRSVGCDGGDHVPVERPAAGDPAAFKIGGESAYLAGAQLEHVEHVGGFLGGDRVHRGGWHNSATADVCGCPRGHHLGGSVDEELLERAQRSGGLDAVAALVDGGSPSRARGRPRRPPGLRRREDAAERRSRRPPGRPADGVQRRARVCRLEFEERGKAELGERGQVASPVAR